MDGAETGRLYSTIFSNFSTNEEMSRQTWWFFPLPPLGGVDEQRVEVPARADIEQPLVQILVVVATTQVRFLEG